jgi:hypothetical protein
MITVSRKAIFEQAAQRMRQEFQELITVPHRGMKGQEAEKIVRTFLSDHLPTRFKVGSGFIIDPLENVSKQTDVVVYDAFNCPVYRASEDAAIFPSDNVAAVVEVKSRLDKEQLRQAYENIHATKQLAKTLPPEVPFIIKWHTLGCLFAFESAIGLDTLAQHYYKLLMEYNLQGFIDIIVVLDRGIITLAAKPQGGPDWGMMLMEGMGGLGAEGTHIAIAVQELGSSSVDGFFRFLLTHLTFFRGIVDNPGFNWKAISPEGLMNLTYLTTISFEMDPDVRTLKLQKYLEQVKEDFAKEQDTSGNGNKEQTEEAP